MNTIYLQKKKAETEKKHKKGFALLFTILIITLVLNIGLGISSLAYKQTILSGLAKDSQVAFYEADAAVECGLYYSLTLQAFPRGSDRATAYDTYPEIYCGDNTLFLVVDTTDIREDYFVYSRRTLSGSEPCMEVVFDKTDPTVNSVRGNGFNSCTFSPRQVERTLEVKY